jgi:hypothetical protein
LEKLYLIGDKYMFVKDLKKILADPNITDDMPILSEYGYVYYGTEVKSVKLKKLFASKSTNWKTDKQYKFEDTITENAPLALILKF